MHQGSNKLLRTPGKFLRRLSKLLRTPGKLLRTPGTLLLNAAGCLLLSVLASTGSAADDESTESSSSDIIQSALHLAEESSAGFVLTPELLDSTPPDEPLERVSHLDSNTGRFQDPQQLFVDSRQFTPTPPKFRSTTWQASVDVLAMTRLDEKVLVDQQELGTATNAGLRVRLLNQLENAGVINAWDVVAVGFGGEDSLGDNPTSLFAPNPVLYEASLFSIESNLINRREHKGRVRQQFVGIRYVDQGDTIEIAGPFFDSAPLVQEAQNRMFGLQVGIEQSWSSRRRLRFRWGAKAGVFYNSAQQSGFVYNASDSGLPLLLDCHADLGYRVTEHAHLGFGLVGLRLEDQYQSRFSWQAPDSTDALTILGMRLGFDYAY